MSPGLVVLVLGGVLAAVFWVGFRHLPRERWQILATVPLRPGRAGEWVGLNLTYYGLLLAGAGTTALAVALVLLAAIGVPSRATIPLCLTLVFAAAIASRLVARLVERKEATLTVAGAATLALLLTVPAIALTNRVLGTSVHPLPVLSALLVAYLFGEGLGRLACISFGCCYGRPVEELAGPSRWLFERLHFRFYGRTKKIAYASGLEGTRVVPVQGLTAVLFGLAGLVSVWLFLEGRPASALAVSAVVSQAWRLCSESLRADHRGHGRFSAYQWMALANLLFLLVLSRALAWPPVRAHLTEGLAALWDPLALLVLLGCFLALFALFGRSEVTGAHVSFHVNQARI